MSGHAATTGATGRDGSRLGQVPALDGIRAIAIVLVMLNHTGANLFYQPFFAPNTLLAPAGFLGVDLFFVLSGFLITTLLLERREREQRPLLTFYRRRALRLVPALVTFLTGYVIASAILGLSVSDAAISWVAGLTYTINYAEILITSHGWPVSHLWSLAVEGQFYLIWAPVLLALLALRQSLKRILIGLLVVILLVSAWRFFLYHHGVSWLSLYLRTDTRIDSILVGAALAVAGARTAAARLTPRTRSILWTCAFVAFMAAVELLNPNSAFFYSGGYTLIAIICGVLVVAVAAGQSVPASILSTPVPVLIGRLSYSLYLWHAPIFFEIGKRTTDWPGAGRVIFAWGLSFAAAGATYHFVERPLLRRKDGLGRRMPPIASPRPSVPAARA